MAQFDVHRNSNPASRRSIPYLVDVQSDLLESLSTRVVIPLLRQTSSVEAVSRLNPAFEIDGVACVLSTAELAGVLHSNIGAKVGSLNQQRAAIINALDFLITGI
ncbi:MAG: CcdB family protein [Gammaproteobacteria bacterium]|nr:CcdB family protein [Gammaproteobacteria bacterium]